jgi:predicted nucleic acid-binding Zn ribbon protein
VSKYQKESAPVIVKHKHCLICATPIPMSKDFCSTTCEDENKRLGRRRKYTFILTLAMFPVLFILLFVLRGVGK